MPDMNQWLLTQGPFAGMLAISLGFNWFLLKVVVSALKDNTIALTALKTVIEAKR